MANKSLVGHMKFILSPEEMGSIVGVRQDVLRCAMGRCSGEQCAQRDDQDESTQNLYPHRDYLFP